MDFKLEAAIKNNDLPGVSEYTKVLESELASNADHQALVHVRDLIATNTSCDKTKLNLVEDIVNAF